MAGSPQETCHRQTPKGSKSPQVASISETTKRLKIMALSNYTLIHRFLQGEKSAFEQLLDRHRGWILSLALRTARDDDEAEDLAQEICIEMYLSLPGIKDPHKFKGWLATIARRVSYRWKEGMKSPYICMDTLVWDTGHRDTLDAFADPGDLYARLELRDRIRQALRTLTHTHRQITILHYIDGYSLEEISRRLHVPEGTVKRRLHESRKRLREEIIMMDAPTTLSHDIKKIHFHLWGQKTGDSMNPLVLTRSLLAGQILHTIHKEGKTADRIAQEVGAAVPYVQDHLDRLEQGDVVTQSGKKHYRANCIIVAEHERDALIRRIRTIGKRDAEIIAEELPRVREAFDRCSFERQGYGWDHMQWIIIPVFLANQGIRQRHAEVYSITPPLRPDGGRWYVIGMQGTHRHQWTAGCNISGDKTVGTLDFWTPAIRKEYAEGPYDPERRKIMVALSEGPVSVEQVAEAGGLETDRVQELLAILCEGDFVRRQDETFTLNFPILYEEDSARLLSAIDPVCTRIVEENRKPGMRQLDILLDELGLNHLRSDYPALKASLASDISGYCFEQLVKTNVLLLPPKKAPANWGFCGWIGQCALVAV